MKSFKKIIATALSAVMMMAMSVTAFAAESVAITIENAENATITYAQVIKEDTKTTSGWAFTSNDYAEIFKTKTNTTNDQDAINAYIKASESTRAAIVNGIQTSNTTGVVKNVINVSAAGLYVINASEEGFSYITMAAGIGMNYEENGVAGKLIPMTIKAKKEPTKVSKTAKDYVETTTEEFTYTVTTKVPYVLVGDNETLTGAKFAINDKLTGGVYAVDENGNLPVVVKVGETVLSTIKSVKVDAATNSFELDLSELVDASNSKANLPVVVEYNAIGTSTTIENDAFPTIKGHKHNEENGYTTEKKKTFSGEITITKTDDKNKVLAGAKFVVLNEAGQFAKLNSENMLIAWVDEASASYVVTGNDGKAVVKGFDPTKKYTVREIEAPNGYSIINKDTVVTWNGGKALPTQPTVIYGNANVQDSPLSVLPFTGGIGTTIFTVLGIILMSAAAALYFLTKKKDSVN